MRDRDGGNGEMELEGFDFWGQEGGLKGIPSITK